MDTETPRDVTLPMDSLAHRPPQTRRRIATDLRVGQIEWWSSTVSLLPLAETGSRPNAVVGAWRTIRFARRFDVFVSANVRSALALGLFRRITRQKRPLLMMTEMRLDDPRPTLGWRLKVGLQRFAFAGLDAMCLSARREAEAYSERLNLPLQRFRFVPWHTNVLKPRFCPAEGDYVFAAGRTGRDWRTLAEAVRGLDASVTVVCAKRDEAEIPFPANVKVLTDIPYAEYRQLLEGARLVLIPLEPHVYSSGQVVILEAMAYGKPVIASRVLGSEDYIVDGSDGLLVAPGSASELRDGINRVLTTPGLGERLGRAALSKVLETHMLDQYVRRILAIAEEVTPA